MNFVSQKDSRWANKTIGSTPYTIKAYGCLCSCIAMILDTTPDVVASKPYFGSDGAINNHSGMATALGTTFNSDRSKPMYDPTIIETRFDGSLHFIVSYQGKIYDPLSLNGTPLRNYQHISFRNYKPKESEMLPQEYVVNELYEANGHVLWHPARPEIANATIQNWSIRRPLSDLIPPTIVEKVVEKIVEKPVEVPFETIKYQDSPETLAKIEELSQQIKDVVKKDQDDQEKAVAKVEMKYLDQIDLIRSENICINKKAIVDWYKKVLHLK